MHKLMIRRDGDDLPFTYDNRFELSLSKRSRMKIAPKDGHISLLSNLANFLQPPYYILYVLVRPHWGKSGRYQSPLFEDHIALEKFLLKYREFLENDARHHLWIGQPNNDGLLVYDQHNIIFAYGPVLDYRSYLTELGYVEGEVKIPFDHVHFFHPENKMLEKAFLEDFSWERLELKDGDDY